MDFDFNTLSKYYTLDEKLEQLEEVSNIDDITKKECICEPCDKKRNNEVIYILKNNI